IALRQQPHATLQGAIRTMGVGLTKVDAVNHAGIISNGHSASALLLCGARRTRSARSEQALSSLKQARALPESRPATANLDAWDNLMRAAEENGSICTRNDHRRELKLALRGRSDCGQIQSMSRHAQSYGAIAGLLRSTRRLAPVMASAS